MIPQNGVAGDGDPGGSPDTPDLPIRATTTVPIHPSIGRWQSKTTSFADAKLEVEFRDGLMQAKDADDDSLDVRKMTPLPRGNQPALSHSHTGKNTATGKCLDLDIKIFFSPVAGKLDTGILGGTQVPLESPVSSPVIEKTWTIENKIYFSGYIQHGMSVQSEPVRSAGEFFDANEQKVLSDLVLDDDNQNSEPIYTSHPITDFYANR
jgi:hypothetical protein